MNLSKAVLAGMRKNRNGTIVNISSIGGLVSFPMTGYYHATKYAVEGLSESLAIEFAPFGVKVIVVEPGPFRTDWSGRSLQKSDMAIPDYEAMAPKVRQMYENGRGKQAGDPIRAAEAIITAVGAENPPSHLLLGKAALENAQRKLGVLTKEFDAWKATTLGADFPAA